MAATGLPFHHTITFAGTAEALPSTLPGVGPIRSLHLQPDPANSDVIYIGGRNKTLTSSDYGVILPAPSGGIPCAPYPVGNFDDGSVSIDAHFVLGTAGQKLHLFGYGFG